MQPKKSRQWTCPFFPGVPGGGHWSSNLLMRWCENYLILPSLVIENQLQITYNVIIKMWFPDFIAEFLFRRCLKMSFKMASSMSCKVQTSWVSNSSVVDLIGLWKWSSAHALGGVSGVASFITTDEQLQ